MTVRPTPPQGGASTPSPHPPHPPPLLEKPVYVKALIVARDGDVSNRQLAPRQRATTMALSTTMLASDEE